MFSDAQIASLEGDLAEHHVRTRLWAGQPVRYIEGRYAIAEANRIFGFGGWTRETLELKLVWRGKRTLDAATPRARSGYACSYLARVRVAVLGDGVRILRDGTGAGHGADDHPGEAHARAIKQAETDATKRALVTFGTTFGLALHGEPVAAGRTPTGAPARWAAAAREIAAAIEAAAAFDDLAHIWAESQRDPKAMPEAARRRLQESKDRRKAALGAVAGVPFDDPVPF